MKRLLPLGDCLPAALNQSDFGTPYAKPTRVFFRIHPDCPLDPRFLVGLPTYDEEGYYVGPLPRVSGLQSLMKTSGDVGFRNTGTAAWPDQLSETIADSLQQSWLLHIAGEGDNSTVQQLGILGPTSEPVSDLFPTYIPATG